jgi:hypothetical protein
LVYRVSDPTLIDDLIPSFRLNATQMD